MNFRKVLPISLFALALLAPGAGALATGRHGHTTTLLPDGNILVAGGTTGAANVSLNSVEIYFTSAAAFGAAPNMPASLSSHTATLMGNGMVLVAGGFTNGVPVNSAAIYNPLTKTWTPVTATLASTRGGHTATLLNKGASSGKVLICGGQTASETSITNTCEVFTPNVTPALGNFASVQAMSSERMGHSASAIAGGRVFVSGGRRWDAVASTFTYLSTNEIYDPENYQWQTVTALTTGRTDHSAVVLNNGTILISGGYNGIDKLDTAEEGWYKTPLGSASNQNAGSKGFLDSAEIFDSYGGRVPVSGSDYQVMPYRNSKHAAALSPDGKQHMYGGYGNIPPKFFFAIPTMETGSQLDTTKTNITTARVNTSSILRYLLDINLSRPVDGRLVDADIFISRAVDGPSLSVSNASIYIDGPSTATVDGFTVGLMVPGVAPGEFRDIVQPQNPTGTVSFAPVGVASIDTYATSGSLVFSITPIPVGNPPVPLTAGSVLTIPVTIEVSPTYVGGIISGTMTITGASISDNLGYWLASLTGGTGEFTSGAVTYDAFTGMGVASGNVAFSALTGTIINSTTTAIVSSPLATTASDPVTSVSLRAYYTSTRIDLSDLQYAISISTFVVREMIFSDNLEYSPDKAKWQFGQVLYPVFNLSALVTPGADTAIIGGRNCELIPSAHCKRAALAPVFTASNISGAFISQNHSTWSKSGKLANKRAFHTSTLLPDDGILTCGGSDGTATLATCEMFYPAEQEWRPAGTMNYPRSRHTATLLPNGRVLAAGGAINSSTHAVTYAEIYYPDTDKWLPTNSMAFARTNHTATLLPDGNVLMAGGDTINGYSATSEIYLTTSSVWLTAGALANGGRAQHTATLLKSGNVLIAGGINGNGAIKTTEVYNFATRTWTDTGDDLQVKRYAHAANLLMDGRVMVTGGTDGYGPMDTAEVYDGLSWKLTTQLGGNNMLARRTGHRSTLLPNGKVLITGGEAPGIAYSLVEGYDVDFSTWQSQGETSNRSNHTTVLTSSGTLLAIGGWDGAQYLDTTETIYFSAYPDTEGFAPKDLRNPLVSTGTTLFDRGDRLTLLGNTSNFHGISEASGGGSGSMNSSFHNPRIYLQQIDNPSGFLTDMTTRLYTTYGGPNTAWDKTISSITIISPITPGEMPYGWYHARIAANGQFSNGVPVQVSAPRPTGSPTAPVGAVLGTSSITWSWTSGTSSAADGYALYSSSDNVFITTTAFSPSAAFTQTSLQPNTAASVKANTYNTGGSGQLAQSSTYYTLAAKPTALTVMDASFTTAKLEWGSANAPGTPFEVSMCAGSDFADPVLISTPVPFNLIYTSTSATVDRLLTNTRYFFRVRAKNGEGVPTDFSNRPSTLTVSDVGTLTGTPTSSSTINWAWNSAVGADFYEIFDVTADTANPVYVGSTTYTDFTQSGLGANRPYAVFARAVNNDPSPVYGPMSASGRVYTLAGAPSPDPANIFTNVSTGSFTANWLTNDNSTWTVYGLMISTSSLYLSSGTSSASVIGNSHNFSGLAANFRYYVKLAAINGDGIPSEAVSLGSKYTLARAPAQVTPATVAISGVTITWSQNNNTPGTVYELRGTTGSFTGPVTTYVPFSLGYTGNAYTLTGLLTSTTYYFDVTARNGENILTSRSQAVPAAFTDDKLTSAPAGSIAGTSDPAQTVTITGTLPNSRTVTLTVPAESFPAATAIAISPSATNNCGSYLINGRTVEVAVYTQNNAQPQTPVTLSVSYDGFIVPSSDIYSLVLARDNGNGVCLPLETRIDTGLKTITATLNHFSVFQLMFKAAATNLNDVLVYPNPFKPNRGNGFVTIANLPASSKLRVYTLSGAKVWEGTAGTTGIIIWRGLNDAGNLVASGVYLAVIDSSAGKKVLKLAVER
ncbi:MAG: hypothetical protein A2081_02445 [Elusimicrobia bacterium GWC2_61_19]|nr:MAG: hypothetical protein A2081_02445 [Elusimicrobia bacterium GWC2_61_19]